MLSKITVSPAPHISQNLSTQRVMLDVIIGLAPAAVMALVFFRVQAALVMATCAASCMFFEWLCNIIRKKPNSLSDLSAVVTGLILAMSLPPAIPLWAVVIGSGFAIMITKMLFGGLGSNVFNPAMAARVFLTASFGSLMTTWTVPATLGVVSREGETAKVMAAINVQNNISNEDMVAVTQATPLGWCKTVIRAEKKAAAIAQAKETLQAKVDASDDPAEIAGLTLKIEQEQGKFDKAKAEASAAYVTLKNQLKASFIGQVGGCLGETSSLALLIGGIYLLIRKTIPFHIPAAVLIAAFVFAEIFYLVNPEKYSIPLLQLFSGGMLICAFFIATDPVTAPLSAKGMWIFGAGVGALIMLIRFFGAYEEGVMFAVLIMNSVSPLIDRMCKHVPAGGKPHVK